MPITLEEFNQFVAAIPSYEGLFEYEDGHARLRHGFSSRDAAQDLKAVLERNFVATPFGNGLAPSSQRAHIVHDAHAGSYYLELEDSIVQEKRMPLERLEHARNVIYLHEAAEKAEYVAAKNAEAFINSELEKGNTLGIVNVRFDYAEKYGPTTDGAAPALEHAAFKGAEVLLEDEKSAKALAAKLSKSESGISRNQEYFVVALEPNKFMNAAEAARYLSGRNASAETGAPKVESFLGIMPIPSGGAGEYLVQYAGQEGILPKVMAPGVTIAREWQEHAYAAHASSDVSCLEYHLSEDKQDQARRKLFEERKAEGNSRQQSVLRDIEKQLPSEYFSLFSVAENGAVSINATFRAKEQARRVAAELNRDDLTTEPTLRGILEHAGGKIQRWIDGGTEVARVTETPDGFKVQVVNPFGLTENNVRAASNEVNDIRREQLREVREKLQEEKFDLGWKTQALLSHSAKNSNEVRIEIPATGGEEERRAKTRAEALAEALGSDAKVESTVSGTPVVVVNDVGKFAGTLKNEEKEQAIVSAINAKVDAANTEITAEKARTEARFAEMREQTMEIRKQNEAYVRQQGPLEWVRDGLGLQAFHNNDQRAENGYNGSARIIDGALTDRNPERVQKFVAKLNGLAQQKGVEGEVATIKDGRVDLNLGNMAELQEKIIDAQETRQLKLELAAIADPKLVETRGAAWAHKKGMKVEKDKDGNICVTSIAMEEGKLFMPGKLQGAEGERDNPYRKIGEQSARDMADQLNRQIPDVAYVTGEGRLALDYTKLEASTDNRLLAADGIERTTLSTAAAEVRGKQELARQTHAVESRLAKAADRYDTNHDGKLDREEVAAGMKGGDLSNVLTSALNNDPDLKKMLSRIEKDGVSAVDVPVLAALSAAPNGPQVASSGHNESNSATR